MSDDTGVTTTDTTTGNSTDASVDADVLLPRLRLIEDQPLASRAEAFARVHDELQSVLERGDLQQRHA
jgi:hypothetical protein